MNKSTDISPSRLRLIWCVRIGPHIPLGPQAHNHTPDLLTHVRLCFAGTHTTAAKQRSSAVSKLLIMTFITDNYNRYNR